MRFAMKTLSGARPNMDPSGSLDGSGLVALRKEQGVALREMNSECFS